MEDATVGLWASGMQVNRINWCGASHDSLRQGEINIGLQQESRTLISNAEASSKQEPMDDGMHHDLCAGHLLVGHRFLPEDVQTAARFLADCSGIQFTHFHQRTGGRRRRRRKHQHHHDHVK